ncbi:iron complex outermembrane recepter protein [Novosphingobium sp. CF614]|uniref:TonB-dependent siderophore receptor n=1 Tax=Novosphingobium sp. CF614 TaxID=1884364 RepID=UPI0008E0CABC|nr:TonB-dependent siderophore receptor [Novosphingobium sp. CF614]SFG03591.1 iron complex outermembrane recepter protein [Novosphingobium sp. CF614]
MHHLLSTTAICLSLTVAPAAFAETEQQDSGAIVVTAQPFVEGEISKFDTPLIRTPQAISVVTADQIRDRGITDLNDALRSVAGVSRSSTYGYYDAYTIRGYDTAYDSLYLDGLITSSVAGTNYELAGLERVEVLKGPASSLYGSAPIGGIVNLVTKRPQEDTFLVAGVATGSYDLVEGRVDANMPLDKHGRFLFRLNALYSDQDDFVAHAGKNRLFVAPALTVVIGENTHLTVLGRWQRDHDNPWSPLPAEGTVLPNANGPIPYAFPINYIGDQKVVNNQDYKSIGYIFDHDFTDSIRFTQTLRYTHAETFWNNWVFADAFVDSGYIDGVQQGHIFGIDLYGPFYQTDKAFGVDSRVSAKLDTGPFSHQILVGYDYRQLRSAAHEDGGNYDVTVNTLDYLDPDYTRPLIHDPIFAYSSDSKSHQSGVYVQDQIGLGDKLFITAGGRWDWLVTNGKKDNDFSPRIGANYLITPQVALYASWSRSFSPQFGWMESFDGTALPNGRGKNIEAGLKVNVGGFSATASVFQLTRTNVPTADPLHAGYYVVTGEQRSRGFEMEAAWSPARGANLSLAYTYIDAKITRDNDIPSGTRLGNVPHHNLYVRGEYELQAGALKGLGASLALLWNSDKVGDTSSFYDADGDGTNDAAFRLPGYVIVDAGIFYRLADWRVAVNIDNLFDKHYYPEASYYTRVAIGEPRSWRLSLSRRF